MKKALRRTIDVIPLITIGISAVLVVGFILRTLWIYKNGHEIERDKTTNVNVLLTRPDNWRKIETGQISLSKEELGWIDGSTATIPITAELARQFCDASDSEINDYVDHNKTHRAYENLIHTESSRSDSNYDKKYLIFATEPSDYELNQAENNGVKLDVTPIALDGFVFITHKDNPIDSLTVEQIQKIYSGEITNWSEVGGDDTEIIPYQRESNSGSQTAMEQLVMKDCKLMEPAVGYRITSGMGGLIEKVAEYENRKNSIGYTYYYYINNLYKNENIKVLKVDGVSPDHENLISGAYPFTTAYYAVIEEGHQGKMTKLRDYLLTDEGQEIIKMAGYCPVREEAVG